MRIFSFGEGLARGLGFVSGFPSERLRIFSVKDMLTHIVIFRTRNADKVGLLREGVETLRAIDGVKFFHCGAPVPSQRPVVDDFFDVALVVAFENDEDGLARYASHPVHVNFVENYLKPAGGKLLVYDVK